MSAPTSCPDATVSFQPLPIADLPIFRLDRDRYAIFYVPGCLCVVGLSDADRFEATIGTAESPETHGQGFNWAVELRRRAYTAVEQAALWQEQPFRPLCLTLYLNNECNLGCTYCYTDPSFAPATRLDPETIAAAADVVAENCRKEARVFYAVFHGGGEPTLHQDRMEKALALVEAAADAHGVDLFRYIATNGVMPEPKAVWLAGHFDLIGLSCDGPADIHDRQRPLVGGAGTLQLVERTARVLKEEGCPLHVRTTITRASLHRQVEIAEYLCQRFAPQQIHFEPVYLGGRTSTSTGLTIDDADAFVAHFLQARRLAQGYGIRLLGSGTRPGAIHGPYCHVFRDVLNLVPGGIATACFKPTRAEQVERQGLGIGRRNPRTGRFDLDQGLVQALRRRLSVPLPACRDCFNRYHCARECPDRCPLDDVTWASDAEPGFRCRVQKALSLATLQEIAERLWSEMVADGNTMPRGARIP